MTEDEAKTKWCPFVRAASGRYFDDNPAGHSVSRCIASDCMAWRWETTPEAAKQLNARGHGRCVPRGYCGLAGAPQ